MDFANYWYSSGSAGTGEGDPGDPIGQSLRFIAANDASCSHLIKSSGFVDSSDVWTLSCWIKGWNAIRTGEASAPIMSWYDEGNNQNIDELHVQCNSNRDGNRRLYFMWSGSRSGVVRTLNNYRDSSGWFHVVAHSRGGANGFDLFVNGKQAEYDQSTFNGSTQWINKNKICSIGFRAWSHLQNTATTGHMAQMYFIDGTAHAPTEFGRVNDNGVWVPKNYSGTYGTNGFHLDFSDINNLGKDKSGNNNDFTPVGFDITPPVYYSGMVSYTNLTHSTGSAAYMFQDDTLSTDFTNPFPVVFTPTIPITVNSNVNIWVENPGITASINGGAAQTLTTGQYTDIAFSGELTSISFDRAGQTSMNLTRIAIDGSQLVNYRGDDYPLMQDSPTQNYATLNEEIRTGFGTNHDSGRPNCRLEYGNLHAVSGGGGSYPEVAQSTQYHKRTYFEIGPSTNGDYYPVGSFFNASYLNNTRVGSGYFDAGGTGSVRVEGGATLNNYSPTWNQRDDVVRFSWDEDTTTLGIAVNGSDWFDMDMSTVTNFSPDVIDTAMGIGGVSQSSHVNFGSRPFAMGPRDSTYAVQTTDALPEVTIYNGRDHHETFIGPGQGDSPGINNGDWTGNWSQGCFSVPNSGGNLDFGAIATSNTLNGTISGPPIKGFDGSSGSYFLMSGSYTAGVRFDPPIENVTEVRCWQFDGQGNAINGVDQGNTAGGSEEVIYSGPAITLETFVAWHRTSNNGGWYTLSVGVDGNPARVLVDASVLGAAQQKFPQGLWWVKDRENSNQHQLCDTVMFDGTLAANNSPSGAAATAGNYVAPSGSSVCWAWDASDPETTGFNIIKSTNAAAGPVAHGLPARPSFFMFKQYLIGDNIYTWHKDYEFNGTAFQYQILLSNTGVSYGSSNLVTAVDETNITFGGAVTQPQIIYAWCDIPGYSKAGYYNGVNSFDGPSIYTGFKPAFVMTKGRIGEHWTIFDNVRSTYNQRQHWLMPNKTDNEYNNDNNCVDFLCNGFKIRSSDAQSSHSQGMFYIAFAECPFGGKGNAPSTAGG